MFIKNQLNFLAKLIAHQCTYEICYYNIYIAVPSMSFTHTSTTTFPETSIQSGSSSSDLD